MPRLLFMMVIITYGVETIFKWDTRLIIIVFVKAKIDPPNCILVGQLGPLQSMRHIKKPIF
jgi:hypothetical protein